MPGQSRRQLLQVAAGAGAGFLGMQSVARGAQSITVTAFGGIFGKAVSQSFNPCFTRKTSAAANLLLGSPAVWISKIVANPSRPPIDVLLTTGASTVEAVERGLTEPLTAAKVPHLAQIPSKFYRPFDNLACSFNFGDAGILYNRKKIPDPPKTWLEFFDRTIKGEFGRRVSMPSVKYNAGPEFLWLIGTTFGGGLMKMDVAFEKVKAMKRYVPKFWTTPDEPVILASTDQVDIEVFLDGRAWDFIDGGAGWASFYYPAPGGLAVTVEIAKVKHGSPLAWSYLDCMLSPAPDLAFSKIIKYPVTNSHVVYPSALKQRLASLDDSILAPIRAIQPHVAGWIERWDREIGA